MVVFGTESLSIGAHKSIFPTTQEAIAVKVCPPLDEFEVGVVETNEDTSLSVDDPIASVAVDGALSDGSAVDKFIDIIVGSERVLGYFFLSCQFSDRLCLAGWTVGKAQQQQNKERTTEVRFH